MKIAITINSFYRNERTPSLLRRALDSVYNQTHQDFKIFLIGDKYTDTDSWDSIADDYSKKGKIHCENLPKAIERDEYSDKMILWCCGGCNALLIANKMAILEGFDYIAHLDHDDYWEPNHLDEINKCIEQTKADFICTKSSYGSIDLLPKLDSTEYYIPFLPVGGGIIHSSICYNHSVIPLQIRNVYKETNTVIPSDGDLWDRINVYMNSNNLKGYCINKITCHHDEEGATYGG